MGRSYRGLGLVVLMLLVVAPLTLFAVLALFEVEASDSIALSLDGESWTTDLDGALLASRQPWEPGQVRSAIVYVKNGGPAPVDAVVSVLCSSSDEVVTDDHLALTAQVDAALPQHLQAHDNPHAVHVQDLGSDQVVPVTLAVTLADTAPLGATLDDRAVHLELRVTGTRTKEAGAPSLLDATGAQLWLAPILLVFGAGVATLGRGRRRQAPHRTGDTRG